MQITITPAAQAKLEEKYQPSENMFILDLDDGVSSLSEQGNCALIQKFKIYRIKIAELPCEFNQEIPSNFSHIYSHPDAEMFFDTKMKIDLNPQNQTLILSGAHSGILSDPLELIDLTD